MNRLTSRERSMRNGMLNTLSFDSYSLVLPSPMFWLIGSLLLADIEVESSARKHPIKQRF